MVHAVAVARQPGLILDSCINLFIPKSMQQLNIQLYGRTSTKKFNERLSARTEVTLSPAPKRIELSLDAPANGELVELRLDPDDKPSTFFLHDLRVRSYEGTELYGWDGKPESLTALTDIQAWTTDNRVAVQSVSNDPFLLLPLAAPQSEGIVVEISVSQVLLVQVAGPDAADASRSSQQRELAQAVRSLESGLRFALDDLAAEQEGVVDSLILHQANARLENHSINQQLATVAERTDAVKQSTNRLKGALDDQLGLFQETSAAADAHALEFRRLLDRLLSDGEKRHSDLATAFSDKLRKARNEILQETRDDWRSLSRQIGEKATSLQNEARKRDSKMIASMGLEVAKLTGALNRLAGIQLIMKEIREELGVARDEDAIAKLQKLKADAQAARDQVAMQSSLSWHLMRPFRALRRSSK